MIRIDVRPLLIVIVIAVAAVVLLQYPDIQRYLRLRSM